MPKNPRTPSLADVEPHDSSFRWLVRSRTGSARYMVDLGAYGGNGRCSCKDYEVRMEPILKHGKNPADAVDAGIIELREYHLGPWMACMCWHIVRARDTLTTALIAKLKETEAAQR